MNISEVLKSDSFKKEMIEKLAKTLIESKESRKCFWDSATCQKMIEDIKVKDYVLDNETWSYFSDNVRKDLNWQIEEISNKDVDLFFDCMSSEELPKDRQSTVDECCIFENVTLYRNGLSINLMFGQGTSIIIKKY